MFSRSIFTAGIAALSLAPSVAAGQASPAPAPFASHAASTVDPAIAARARDWLHRAETGTIDRSQLDERMNALLTDELARRVASQMKPLGEPTAFAFVEKRRVGTATAYRFLATFASTNVTEFMALDDAGKIVGLRFVPATGAAGDGDGRQP